MYHSHSLDPSQSDAFVPQLFFLTSLGNSKKAISQMHKHTIPHVIDTIPAVGLLMFFYFLLRHLDMVK